uniref:Uncharacterized protein n=1 Tax=Odontella aurita TaxID=265563 RepID=A0A7S4KAE9_9STRA
MPATRNGRVSLLVAVALCSSACLSFPRSAAAAACDRSCKIQARSALCKYTKCVLRLDREDRFDAKDRRKKCGSDSNDSKRGRAGRDGGEDDDFVFGESDCLPSLTEDVADLFAKTCAEGGLKILDACEWGRMYVERSCGAEAERVEVSVKNDGSEEQDERVFKRSQCDEICPPDECTNLEYSCVTSSSRKQCTKLQQEGCQNIYILEACPYEYTCADSNVGRGLIEDES